MGVNQLHDNYIKRIVEKLGKTNVDGRKSMT